MDRVIKVMELFQLVEQVDKTQQTSNISPRRAYEANSSQRLTGAR
jgi:hypothetical protein